MQSQERSISGSTINILLEPDHHALSDVVVTGYKADGILQGRVPGIMTNRSQASKPGDAQVIATTVRENPTTKEIEAESLKDTLSISLARDRGIGISREKLDQFSRKRVVGSNVDKTRAYRIIVKNNKSQKITLTLIDQVPVSIVNDISET